MIATLANGAWLTWDRIRAFAIISGAFTLLVLGYLYVTATGTVDAFGRPLGTDFSNVWTAGRMALEGNAPWAWDWPSHYAVQQATHHRNDIPFYGWHYPPPFLLVAMTLASMPYIVALLIWQTSTFAAATLVLYRILPDRRALLVGLTAPVNFVCLGHGQNGFLTAALLGGGLLLLDRRQLIAGLLLGCLVYKPQFALVIPPLLMVSGKWRALLGTALSMLALVAITLAIWGWPVWQAFLDSLPLTRKVIIENGATGWEKIQSPFALIRMWHGSVGAAYLVQSIVAGIAIAAILRVGQRTSPEVRNAVTMVAVVLSTPYVLDYDFVTLGLGSAFLIADGRRRGFLSYEKTLIAFSWFAPLIARQLAYFALVPLGQATAIAIFVLAVRRAIWFDGAGPEKFKSLSFRRSRGLSAP